MKKNNEINSIREESNFEKKVVNKKGCKESLMKFLDTHDILKHMTLNKNIQARMSNSFSYRASSMYVDYLNCLQKTLDGVCGDTDDKTLCDIANEVYKSDLGELCESILKNKVNQQENFHFNTEKKEIDPLLEPCLKIYMMHMILLDLLSITEKDFKNCDVTENSSMGLAIKKIIKKRQQERIQKIFDIILDKGKCEIKTFWDELKMVIDEKKYDELQAERENEFRDVIHLILFRKIFKSDNLLNSIEDHIEKAMNMCKGETLQGIQSRILNKESELREEQQALKKTEQKIKGLENQFDNLEKQSEQVVAKIKEIESEKDKSGDYSSVSIWKSGLSVAKINLSNKLSEQKDIKKIKQEMIEDIQSSITKLKDRLDTKKMLDGNSKFVAGMYSIALAWLKDPENPIFTEAIDNVMKRLGYSIDEPPKIDELPKRSLFYFDFLLDHPDRISSFNFGVFDISYFIRYLLQNYQHKYFYPAIIQTAQLNNGLNKRFDRRIVRDWVNGHRNSDININIDFIEKILLGSCKSEYNNLSINQLRLIDRSSEITFLNIFLTICILAVYVCTLICFIAFLVNLMSLYVTLICSILSLVLSYPCIKFGKFCKTIAFFRDYSTRKQQRVIYDHAMSQLNECKQRTEVYKNKIYKAKEMFDKYLECGQEQPISKQTETKNEEEITTQ